jgi:hypothetical protein
VKAKIFDEVVDVEPRYHVREGFTLTTKNPPFSVVVDAAKVKDEGDGEIWVVSPLIVGVFYPRKTLINELVLVFMRHFR